MRLDLGSGASMELVLIPAGTFIMGSPEGEHLRAPYEGPQHQVTISKSFWMGATEVTQAQYQAVMGVNPSKAQHPDKPVETVSWDDAVEFCRRLGEMTGHPVSLPTEAQWEYACRAGTTTAFSFGDDREQLPLYGWTRQEQETGPTKVASLPPNAWGLHDMHGNVWEWCADWFGPYDAVHVVDPVGPAQGTGRVIRGGRWHGKAADSRSANRSWHASDYRRGIVGFRIVVNE